MIYDLFYNIIHYILWKDLKRNKKMHELNDSISFSPLGRVMEKNNKSPPMSVIADENCGRTSVTDDLIDCATKLRSEKSMNIVEDVIDLPTYHDNDTTSHDNAGLVVQGITTSTELKTLSPINNKLYQKHEEEPLIEKINTTPSIGYISPESEQSSPLFIHSSSKDESYPLSHGKLSFFNWCYQSPPPIIKKTNLPTISLVDVQEELQHAQNRIFDLTQHNETLSMVIKMRGIHPNLDCNLLSQQLQGSNIKAVLVSKSAYDDLKNQFDDNTINLKGQTIRLSALQTENDTMQKDLNALRLELNCLSEMLISVHNSDDNNEMSMHPEFYSINNIPQKHVGDINDKQNIVANEKDSMIETNNIE